MYDIMRMNKIMSKPQKPTEYLKKIYFTIILTERFK